jgi:hypothetical protein
MTQERGGFSLEVAGVPKALVAVEENRRSLGSPGFPVESCGFGQLHVVLFRENHMQWHR